MSRRTTDDIAAEAKEKNSAGADLCLALPDRVSDSEVEKYNQYVAELFSQADQPTFALKFAKQALMAIDKGTSEEVGKGLGLGLH